MSPSPKLLALRDRIAGDIFHNGLETLHSAYRSARSGGARAMEELNARARALMQMPPENASSEEIDEFGRTWKDDLEDQLSEDASDVRDSLRLIEEAFVSALAHYWERFFNRRLGAKQYNAQRVKELCDEKGWPLEEGPIYELRLCSNVTKHSGGDSADKLLPVRPDLFLAERIADGESPSYENLNISDAAVEQFFAMVERSGPRRL